jgi:uncharacterized protein (TIGR04255 family)
MLIFKPENIPQKITPSPIKDVIAGIRYTDNIPLEVFVGLIYSILKQDNRYNCQTPQRLPVNDIPLEARLKDLNLSSQIHYVIDIGHGLSLRLALNSFYIAIQGNYIGWASYKQHIKQVLEIIYNFNLIINLRTVQLKYSSFFVGDKTEDFLLELRAANNNLNSTKHYIRTEWAHDDKINVILQISNNVNLTESGNVTSGSLIDIDANIMTEDFNISSLMNYLEKLHSVEKEIFFSLLKPSFLKSLNPEY